MELEPTEIQGEYRPALSPLGKIGREVELYLYDTLAGGAGFVQQAGAQIHTVLGRALSLLESCPAGCDKSCYRCLRSYKNKFEHELLDRKLGATLLRHLLTGDSVSWDLERTRSSTDLLFNDLQRQNAEGVTFERNAPLTIDGLGDITAPILAIGPKGPCIVGLSGPLTLDEPLNSELSAVKEFSGMPVILVDELLVRSNLPSVSSEPLAGLGA